MDMRYGNTPEYKEMEEKQKNRSEEEDKLLADQFMLFFEETGELKNMDPASSEAQEIVKKMQNSLLMRFGFIVIKKIYKLPLSISRRAYYNNRRTYIRKRRVEIGKGEALLRRYILKRLICR